MADPKTTPASNMDAAAPNATKSISSTKSTAGRWTTWGDFTKDHTRFFVMLPGYLSSYIVPGFALSPYMTECVMNTMNNTCPEKKCVYCTGLHGQLFRLCRVDNGDSKKIIDVASPPVTYAKSFSLAHGRGNEVETKNYAKLVDAIGPTKAYSVHSLCWALLWGQTTGNSINSARDKIFSLSITSLSGLDIFILGWYGPLFAIIGILNATLKLIPGTFPSTVSAILGAILWLPQAIFIAPIGFSSLVRHGGSVV